MCRRMHSALLLHGSSNACSADVLHQPHQPMTTACCMLLTSEQITVWSVLSNRHVKGLPSLAGKPHPRDIMCRGRLRPERHECLIYKQTQQAGQIANQPNEDHKADAREEAEGYGACQN